MIKSNKRASFFGTIAFAVVLTTLLSVIPEVSAKKGGYEELAIRIEAENITSVRDTKKIRYRLPQEIRSEHLLSTDGMEVVRGTDGNVYLEKEHTFEAGEVKYFIVRVRDIWSFRKDDLKVYSSEAERISSALENTPYRELGAALRNVVELEAGNIVDSQGKAGSVSDHIASFRENEKRMIVIWQAIDRLREIEKAALGRKRRSDLRDRVAYILLIMTTFAMGVALVFFLVWFSVQRKKIRC